MVDFAHPAALALLVPLLGFVFLVWRQYGQDRLRARLSLVSRVAICTLLVLALAGFSLDQPLDRQAVVFVADLSASALDTRAAQARFINQAVANKDPDDAFAVVAAGREPVVERVLGTTRGFDGFQSSVAADGSDLGAALRMAGALLPAGYRARVVLLSDGQETQGDAVAQARLLRTRGVVVDVLPLDVWGGPEVLIDHVSAPAVAHEGEHISVRVQAVSNVETTATVRAFIDGTLLEEQTLDLGMGATDVIFRTEASASGLHDVRATITARTDTLPQNNEARAVLDVQGPPRILIVEQREGEGAALSAALSSSGMRVEVRAPAGLPSQVDELGVFDAVVLADVAAESLSEAQQLAVRSYVRDLGRGLLAIGGDTSFGQGDYVGTALDDALPVRSSVRSHRDQGRVALVLVIDRSGSMADDIHNEGTTKLDMARQAASLSVQQLAPRDIIGVLAFDSFQHWVVPVNSVLAIGLAAIQERIGAITSEGGTEIFAALNSGFEAVRRTDAQYKHVILMSDGKSCCGGDYAGLLDRMRTSSVTLSTIAVGGDADQQLMQQLARQGDGRYYFAERARDIPRLMTRETNLATRGPLVEGLVTPRQVSPDPTLSDLARGGLPTLSGYLVTTPKELADVVLVSDAADPLLARWPYGLGRAVAWTSDLRGRWTSEWLDWPGMPRLFSSMVSWTIPAASGPLSVHLRAGASSGYVTVEEATASASGEMKARVAQPGGSALEVVLSGTAPGRYEGEFPLVGPGIYLVRVQQTRDGSVVAAADAGLPVSYAAEFRRVSTDPVRMEQIARAGAGAVLSLTAPTAAFADNLAPVSSPIPLERILLALAALLLPIDVALRRLRVSPAEALDLLRHPRAFIGALRFPWQAAPGASAMDRPTWTPHAPRRTVPPPVLRPIVGNIPTSASASPAAARQNEDASVPSDDDALAETLRWLASRRRTTPDSH